MLCIINNILLRLFELHRVEPRNDFLKLQQAKCFYLHGAVDPTLAPTREVLIIVFLQIIPSRAQFTVGSFNDLIWLIPLFNPGLEPASFSYLVDIGVFLDDLVVGKVL